MNLRKTILGLLLAGSCFATTMAPASAQRDSDHDYRNGYDHVRWQREHDHQWRNWENDHHRHLIWRNYNGGWAPGYYDNNRSWVNVRIQD